MALTNAEKQQAYRDRIKAAQTEPLELGDDLDDHTPIPHGTRTPLEYMLWVMNDPNAEKGRRDKMALAAAQYVHPRIEATLPTKKEQKNHAAAEASEGKFAPAEPPKTQPEYPITYNA